MRDSLIWINIADGIPEGGVRISLGPAEPPTWAIYSVDDDGNRICEITMPDGSEVTIIHPACNFRFYA